IEVVMVSPAAPGQDEKPSAGYFPYTLELIDNRSGATATWGDGSVRFISNGVSLPVARPF
ncbi:MAG: hypothetical protein ACRD9R_11075, partial [Pyrinomonadaceae bacterium]